MNKLFVIGMLGLLLVGSVSAYYCIDSTNDNDEVVKFKNTINFLALKNDIKTHNLTEESFNLKLKYFHPCR